RHEPAQTGLAAPDHAVELAHLIDRLGARFGLRRVTRLIPQDTHIPEFAVMAGGEGALPSPLRGGATRVAQRRRSGWGSIDEPQLYPPPHPSPSIRAFTP